MTKKERIQRAYLRMIDRSVRTPTGCLEYQGSRNADGYAKVRVGDTIMLGHRFAWLATHGSIPKRLNVLHGCDNPPCVETGPGHLHLGSHAENMAEMRIRRRSAAGERQGHAKITNAQAAEIRIRFFTEQITQRELGAEYGLHQSEISRIISRRNFAA